LSARGTGVARSQGSLVGIYAPLGGVIVGMCRHCHLRLAARV